MSDSQIMEKTTEKRREDVPRLLRPLLSEKVSFREVARGDVIKEPGRKDAEICFLVKGEAQVVVSSAERCEMDAERLEPGDAFGDLSFLTGRSWPENAGLVATKASVILDISTDNFQRVLREDPEFTVSLLRQLAKEVRGAERSVFVCRLKPPSSNLTEEFPDHLEGVTIPGKLDARLKELAESGESLVLVGETGVGKELIAYAIFEVSRSYRDVFVPVDLLRMRSDSNAFRLTPESSRALPDATLEQSRMIFGSDTRDPNGQTKTSPGYLELSAGGTLFVRGVDLLTPVTQQRLLDALQTGVYCPVGSHRIIMADFRLICATELDPSHFSPDKHPLLYELRHNAVALPSLRERRDDIPALARHYLAHHAREINRRPPELAPITLKALTDYSWPGNDLELADTMRRVVLATPGEVVRREDLAFGRRKAAPSRKFDLLRIRALRQALTSPLYPAILQSAFVPMFLVILALLFMGPSDPAQNLAAMGMWALAWPGMIIGAFFGARLWCSVCAIGALSKIGKRIVALEIPFPESLKIRSDFLIAGGILFIIWIETATDIRSSPMNLGLLLLTMFVVAFVMNTLYARQAWCRYICPLGGMAGLLARTSLVELRAQSGICLSKCDTQYCYYGVNGKEGCPFGQVSATLHSNQFCKICGNCIKNCPYDAISLNLRFPGQELWEAVHVRTGTGFLVLGLMGGLLSDMAAKTPLYDQLVSWMPIPGIARFTALFIGTILGLNGLVMLASAISHRVYDERFPENYSRFALTLLPLTCMGFLAFHLYYLTDLGAGLMNLLNSHFDVSAIRYLVAIAPPNSTRWVQDILIAVGLVWSGLTMFRLGALSSNRVYSLFVGVGPHFIVATILAGILALAVRSAFQV
ncbi:MAG: cyclic nucleotide-binding domain-containing protein [Deltaproteobacteria bacterium]|nr:cyclic nucleotide-binding domain-containing protein [Deltaproteobacteria bacterium]